MDHDLLHPPTNDDPWWSETVWYEFWVPERRLSGNVYNVFRPNLGVCTSGVMVWDDTGELPWEIRYHDYQWHVPIPESPLTDMTLINGLMLRCKEPARRYEVRYADDGTELDLDFDAFMEPHLIGMDDLRFAGAGHLDQPGHVTGRLVLDGEEIPIDCLAIRDRSWGARPDRGLTRAGYSVGAASTTDAFHVISIDPGGSPDDQLVVAGYRLCDGEVADVTKGRRRTERGADGYVRRVIVEGEDTNGRTFAVEGEPHNKFAFYNRPNSIAWMSLTRWTSDGTEFWGEDQDVWSLHNWRDFKRAGA